MSSSAPRETSSRCAISASAVSGVTCATPWWIGSPRAAIASYSEPSAMSRSSSTSMSSARSQSALSTTRRPSAVRTRRRMLTGSPSAMPSASAISSRREHALAVLVDDAGLEAHRRDHRGHAEVAPEVVVHRPVRDVGARAAPAPDEAVLLEQRDRRADRGARDAEHLCQVGLRGQPVARAQVAVDDAMAQRVGELEAERAARGDTRRAYGATTTLRTPPARISGKASGVSSSGTMAPTTLRMPPTSRASMSSASTWSRWREAYEPCTCTSL